MTKPRSNFLDLLDLAASASIQPEVNILKQFREGAKKASYRERLLNAIRKDEQSIAQFVNETENDQLKTNPEIAYFNARLSQLVIKKRGFGADLFDNSEDKKYYSRLVSKIDQLINASSNQINSAQQDKANHVLDSFSIINQIDQVITNKTNEKQLEILTDEWESKNPIMRFIDRILNRKAYSEYKKFCKRMMGQIQKTDEAAVDDLEFRDLDVPFLVEKRKEYLVNILKAGGDYKNIYEPLIEKGSQFINTVIDLTALGIDEKTANKIKSQLSAFSSEWDRPEMTIYDEYNDYESKF
jgi:hypothetical protein